MVTELRYAQVVAFDLVNDPVGVIDVRAGASAAIGSALGSS